MRLGYQVLNDPSVDHLSRETDDMAARMFDEASPASVIWVSARTVTATAAPVAASAPA